jgi:hypothetical protein
MSWEEVGGPGDQEVPSDNHYHKKSGSMSAKLGRNIRTAMRKRSQSRSSMTSSNSPPTSPQTGGLSIGASRRGSEASLSPSQSSGMRNLMRGSTVTQDVKHQPSISSLATSVPESANSILLQHQISGDPLISYLPRAELSDPRIHSSKLSPFPGMTALGGENQQPRLLHQSSDSVIPTRISPSAPDSIYSLPLPQPTEDLRASDDSAGKKSWLAKAFGQQMSPRSSISRKSSIPEGITPSRKSVDLDVDPFAGPPPPAKPPKHRSASPAVSVVPEVSEEGSRLTRFTMVTRMDNPSPLIEEEPLPSKNVDVLHRMDELLAMEHDNPARPDILDDPPRKLLLATQILQVVNVHVSPLT